MPSLALDGRLIYFAHCPKAGGTSIERFMVDRWGERVGLLGWGWDRLWAWQGGERAGGIPSSPQHYIWTDAAGVLPDQPDAVFAVVRDPVARMVSEYRYQKSERRTGRMGRVLHLLDFSTWLHLMAAVHARNPYAFDNHLRAQAEFVPEGATVFRLEDGLAEVGAWLCRQANEQPPSDMPHDLKSAARPIPVVLHATDIALISSWFAEDFQRFGYPVPDPGLADPDPAIARRHHVVRWLAPAVDALYRRGLI